MVHAWINVAKFPYQVFLSFARSQHMHYHTSVIEQQNDRQLTQT